MKVRRVEEVVQHLMYCLVESVSAAPICSSGVLWQAIIVLMPIQKRFRRACSIG